jgi:glycerol-3-phosphate dehydrogenase (NAD(P)+)
MAKISIIGGGSWGLAMSLMLHKGTNSVKVWEFNPENVRKLQQDRRNDDYLKGIIFPETIYFTNEMQELFTEMPDFVVFAVPSAYSRMTARMASECMTLPLPPLQEGICPPLAIVNLTKGVEEGTLKRMSEVLTEELPEYYADKICTLSGPSHAEEVAQDIVTAVVVAGKTPEPLLEVQRAFSSPTFRVYTSSDIIGVEIGAAVKNIIAVAAGVVAGLGFGDNTMGALMTRGLAEIKRLGVALNADLDTFSGLSGLGDLVTTAISPHSRNRHVGYELGQGKKLDEILSNMVQIAEGVITTKNIRELKEKLNISMPITEAMYQVLFNNIDPRHAVHTLMTRELKHEKV